MTRASTPRELTLVGFSYRSAPIALREQVTFAEDELATALAGFADVATEAFILCTCNRTEVYVVSAGVDASAQVLDFLGRSRAVSRDDLERHAYVRQGDEAVRHLLEVAAGLDSMVLGEAQILGQVANAFAAATAARTVGRVLGHAVPLALGIGKRARAETRIGYGLVSPSSVAVERARQALGDLRSRAVLVIGAGEAGQATVRSLIDAGVSDIVVANRSPQRAHEVARSVGGRAIPQTDILLALEGADIVISSTGASEHLVSAADVAQVMARRPERPLLCIDIAVPRDVDPEVASVPGVHLYNVDDLEAICADSLHDREREVAAVQRIVAEGVADFRAWRSLQRVVPTIGALYQRAEGIRRAEVDRTVRRLRSLSEDEVRAIDAMTSSIVRRILHDPVAALRAHGGDPDVHLLTRSVQELFRLSVDEPTPSGPPA